MDRLRYVLYGKHRCTFINASASARCRSTAFIPHPGKPTPASLSVLLDQSCTLCCWIKAAHHLSGAVEALGPFSANLASEHASS